MPAGTGTMSLSSITYDSETDCASHHGRRQTLDDDRQRGVPPPPPPHIELLKLAECGGRCICRVVSYLDSPGRVAAARSCSYLRDAVGEYATSKRDYDALARFETERARQDEEARRILAEVERLRSLAAASAPGRPASNARSPLLRAPAATRRGSVSVTKQVGGSPRRVEEFPLTPCVMASSATTKPADTSEASSDSENEVLEIKRLLSAEVDASMRRRGEEEESESAVAGGQIKGDEGGQGTGKEGPEQEEEEEGILRRKLSEGRKSERREERSVLAAKVLARQAGLERIEREERAERLRRLADQRKVEEEQGRHQLAEANARLEDKMRAVEEAEPEAEDARIVSVELHRLENEPIDRYQKEEKQVERLAVGDLAAVNALDILERGPMGADDPKMPEEARTTAYETEGLVAGRLAHEEIEAEESLKEARARRTVAHIAGEGGFVGERLAASVAAQLELVEQASRKEGEQQQAARSKVSVEAEGDQLERERFGETWKTEKVVRREKHERERVSRGKSGELMEVHREEDAYIGDETKQEEERSAAGDVRSIKPSTVKRRSIREETDDLEQNLPELSPALIKTWPHGPDYEQEAVPHQPVSQVTRLADQKVYSAQADIGSTPIPCMTKRWSINNIDRDAREPLSSAPSLDPSPSFDEEEGNNAAKRKHGLWPAQVDEDLDSISTMDMRAQSDAFLARVASSGMQTPVSFLHLGSYPEGKVHNPEHSDHDDRSDYETDELADELSVVPTVSHSLRFIPSTPETPLMSTPSPKSLSGAARLEMGSSNHLGDESKFHIFGRVRQLHAMTRSSSNGQRCNLNGETIDGEVSDCEWSGSNSAPVTQQASPGGAGDEVTACTLPVDAEGRATPAASNGESRQPPWMLHVPQRQILSGPHWSLALPRSRPKAVGEEIPFDERGPQPPASEGSSGSAFSPYKTPSYLSSISVRDQSDTSEVDPFRMAAVRDLDPSGINDVEDDGSGNSDSCRESALGGTTPDVLAQFSDVALFGETPRILTDFMAEIVDSARHTWHSLAFAGRRNDIDDAGPIKIGERFYTHNEALQLWRKSKVKLEDQYHAVDEEGLDLEKQYGAYDGGESVCKQNNMPGVSLKVVNTSEKRKEQGAVPIGELIKGDFGKCSPLDNRNRSLDESTILAGNICVDSDEEVGVEAKADGEGEEVMAEEVTLKEEVCGEILDRNIFISSNGTINGEIFGTIGNGYEMRRESRHVSHIVGHSSLAAIRFEAHNGHHGSNAGISSKFHNGGCNTHADENIKFHDGGGSSQPNDNCNSRIVACSPHAEDSHKAQDGNQSPDAGSHENNYDGGYGSCSDSIHQSHYRNDGEMSSKDMEGDTAFTESESKSDTGSEGLVDIVDRMFSPVFGSGADSVTTSDASHGQSESYTTGGESRVSGSGSYFTTGSISVAKSDDIEFKEDIQPKQSPLKKKVAASPPPRSDRGDIVLIPLRSTNSNAHNETESIAGRDSLPSHMGSAYGVEVTSLRGTDCNFIQGKKSERIKIHGSGKSVKSIKGKSCEQSVLGSQYGTEVVFKPSSKKVVTARKPRTLANHNMGVKAVKQNCNSAIKNVAANRQSAVKLAKQSSNASPKGDPVSKPSISGNKGASLRQQHQRVATLSSSRIVPPKGMKAKKSKGLPLKLKLGIKKSR